MVKSMTGYGRGDRSFEGLQVTVELRAVNNRYLDCTVKMPRAYIFAEDAMKARVQSAVGRGKVDVFVTMVHSGGDDMVVTVTEELARSYLDAMKRLYELGDGRVKKNFSATELARFPDVLTVEKQEEDLELVEERLRKRPLEYALKLAFFNAAFTVVWLTMAAAVTASLPQALGSSVWVLYGLVNVVFLLYDYGFSKLIALYIARVQRAVR